MFKISEKDSYTRNSDKRFTLRMNKQLFEIVKKSAEKNRRSVAKEIEYILFKEFEKMDLYTYSKEKDLKDIPKE